NIYHLHNDHFKIHLSLMRSLIMPIFKLRFMPRWTIIFMDICLSFGAIVLSFLLRFNFKTERISSNLFVRSITTSLVIYLLCFLFFESYKEIIRHTTFTGIFKILKSVVVANT